jgi:hypothetical protein
MPSDLFQALATPLEPLAEPAWWIALGFILAASLVVAGGSGRAGREDRFLALAIAFGVALWLLLTPLVGVAAKVLLADG